MLEKEQVSEVNARVFGENMRESFASYDLDTSSWRTSALSLFGGSMSYSETWPRAGMMRNGTSYRLQPLVPRTSVKGSGLWPTPTTDSAQDRQKKYAQGGTPLTMAVKMWPTPRAADFKGAINPSETTARRVETGKANLPEAVVESQRWPTPQASDNRDRGNRQTPAIKRRIEKGKQVMLSMSVSDTSGQLNPMFVCWLMGYPKNWTEVVE